MSDFFDLISIFNYVFIGCLELQSLLNLLFDLLVVKN